MADDIVITVGADVKGIVTAIDKTTRLESSVKKLQKAVESGRISNSQFDKGLLRMSNAAKGYEKSVLDYSKALVTAKAAQEKATAADKLAKDEAKAFATARREATDANQRFDADRAKSIKAARDAAAEEERLRNKYVEGHTAMTIYSRELNDLAMARGKDIISADQQKQAVEQLNVAMARGTGAFANIGSAAQLGGRRINSSGMLIQQAGYQFGDFAVQVQGGTNPMVAFGQQATQMIGAFNLLPASTLAATVGIGVLRVSVLALIASLGVIIPVLTAIGAYFMRASGSSKTFSETLDTLTTSVSSYKSAMEEANSSTDELSLRFGNVSDAMRPFLEDLKELEQIRALNLLSEQFEKLEASSLSFFEVFGAAHAGIDMQEILAEKVGLSVDAYTELTRLVEELKSAETSSDRLIAANRLRQLIDESTGGVGLMTDEMLSFYEEVVKVVLIGGDLEAAMNGSAAEAGDLADEMERVASAALLASTTMDLAFNAMTAIRRAEAHSRTVGRGRGLSAGPTAEEIQANVPAAQLAIVMAEYARLLDEVAAKEESLSETQGQRYADQLVGLTQQLALAREIAEFGGDSAQVRQLESEQRIAAYNREINKQVEANALTQIQADILKNVFAEVVNTESATESLNAELKNAADLLTFAERSAQGLRAALESAANAGNSMQRQISIAQAQINAARQGASTQVAGVRAGTEFDVNSASSGPLAEFAAMVSGSIAAAEAAELERLQGELSGLTDTPSGRGGGGGGGSSNVVDINQILAQRREQIEQERTLLLLTGRQREEKEIYFELLKSNSTATIKLSETELMVAAQLEAAERARNSTIEEQIALQEQLANTIESSMENALMSMVDGTKSVKDAFKSMAAEIIKELYRVLVVQRIVGSASAGTGIAGSIATLFGGISPNANGNAFSGGNIVPFANGGVVGGPSMFPMSGGKTGLMGEAGPEAIMPLKRDKNGRLGVSVEGGSGSVVVNNNINVTGGSDPAAIRMEVAKLMPQITSATKAAVIDARRRGGQMRAAFSS
jgi:hypothetical protein